MDKCRKKYYLPSSHSGGELPGNQRGLSGGSGTQALDGPFVALGRRRPCGSNVMSSVFPEKDKDCFPGISLQLKNIP